MHSIASRRRFPTDKLSQAAALGGLLAMSGLAIAGPSGLLAWSENSQLLEERREQIASLEARHAAIENRVALLDPDGADPDLVGELLRKELNVLHPDEVVVTLEPEPR